MLSLNAAEEIMAQQAADLAVLRTELDETNRGVVALYAELTTTLNNWKTPPIFKSRFLSR